MLWLPKFAHILPELCDIRMSLVVLNTWIDRDGKKGKEN